jgi:hypothetical protein
MVLTYEFTPKIVLDRLLLQSTYRFEIQNTMFIRNMPIENIPAPVILEGINFWICGHKHTGSIMGSLGLPRELRSPRKYTDLRCKYCPTQYEVIVIPHEGIRISVWQNLGSGRSVMDRKWQRITGTGERRRRYSRHCEENLRKAFTFVLCSREEEFKKLAAQAGHWQPWYGRPQKENLEYKSLPARLAEWL